MHREGRRMAASRVRTFKLRSQPLAQLAHLARGGFHVRLGEQGADHCHSGQAAAVQLGDVVLRYAAYGHDGYLRCV